uniref:Homeobox domain-containing protein n=1 Tax=Caenorhabditis tropicalis TaxID=1561998 RepID=A0A1I7UWI8_9PELO
MSEYLTTPSQMTYSGITTQPNIFGAFPFNFETFRSPFLTGLLNLRVPAFPFIPTTLPSTPLIPQACSLEEPYLETILNDLQNPSNQWAEPTDENLTYIKNLSYLSDLFKINPSAFLSLIKFKFPNIPNDLLQSVFQSKPQSDITTPTNESSPNDEVESPPISVTKPIPGKHFSRSQVAILRERFRLCPSIKIKECRKLSHEIQMHPKQIKAWFSSERQRVRRKQAEKTSVVISGV